MIEGVFVSRVLIAAICASALMLSGCDEPVSSSDAKESSAPKAGPAFTVKVDGPFVAGVNPVLNLAVDLHAPGRGGDLIELAGKAVKKVGSDLINGHPPVLGDFSDINFTFHSQDADPGGMVGDKLLHMSFTDKQLRQLTHFGVSDDALLAGATEAGWWTPSNDDAVNDYCAKHDLSEFCSRFVDVAK